MDKQNAVVSLIDHQVDLLSLVRDVDHDKIKNNVLALGDLAKCVTSIQTVGANREAFRTHES